MRCFVVSVLLLILLAASVASAASNNGFFFVQLADTQLGFAHKNADMDPEVRNFEKAVQWINKVKPAFVIISGDLVNAPHDPNQIRMFWRIAGGIDKSIPLYLVPGNHDIGQPTAENVTSYQKLFGKDHYSFSYAGTEFIVLDTSLIKEDNADPALRAAQRKWFEGELAAARKRNASHIFVCTHCPWFMSSADEKDDYFNISGAERKEYLGLMKNAGVDYAIAGHYHREAIAQDGSLHMITTSAIGLALGYTPVGLRVFNVYKDHVKDTYYTLDRLPESISK